MPDQDNDLPFGLYERLITAGLKARLLRFDPTAARVVREDVDPAEAHATLARHVEGLLASALKDLPQEGRAAKQAELANDITGQRYIRHRELGGNILLFVRAWKKQDGLTVPYTFLGAADHESHKGERPIAFVWKLRRPMPADFFRGAKVATA